MLKFKVSSERLVEAVSILDYIALQSGSRDAALRLLPRFLLDKAGGYAVGVVLDGDGDIQSFENHKEAFLQMTVITPKRSEQLIDQVLEAVKNIVNPPSAGGSNGHSSTDSPKAPGG